jgi:hypothetical protein
MKSIIVVFLLMGIAVFYFGCSDNPSVPGLNPTDQVTATLDKKPAPNLFDSTDYDFVAGLGITDDQGRTLAWKGTISGDINGVIKWYMDLDNMLYTGQASHYADRFEIWDSAEETLLLAGDEAGSTTARLMKNSNWRTNGIVTDAAPAYEDWIGRKNHAEGHFTWIEVEVEDGFIFVPYHGYGTFRIN